MLRLSLVIHPTALDNQANISSSAGSSFSSTAGFDTIKLLFTYYTKMYFFVNYNGFALVVKHTPQKVN